MAKVKTSYKPKFDYDSREWYTAIHALAMAGFGDAEIAASIGEKIQEYRNASGGEPLTPSQLEGIDRQTFSKMKGGRYDKWTDEQNKERGDRITQVLEQARMKVNGIVKGTYLRLALGGKKVKNKGTTYRRLKIDGVYTDDEEIQRSETEVELPPNIQALANWLYHHDPEWRKRQRGTDEETSDLPREIVRGINVEDWIDKEMTQKETDYADQP